METAPVQSGSEDDELAALLEAEFNVVEDDSQFNNSASREERVAKRQRTSTGDIKSCPPHPGFMGGICIRCGTLKSADDKQQDTETNVALRYIHQGLEISASEAERMRAGTASRVLAGRKLLLMLDLDHTLLNSSRFGEVDAQGEAVLHMLMYRQPPEAPHIFRLPHMRMWTKLRPGVREFLQRAHHLFELHIYTMGDRDYAAEMAKLLDPLGHLFHGRVISSGDTTQRSVKDLDIVLGNENVVLILDDTEGVWPRHRGNLVQIERYTYFPADARRFGLGRQSLLERRMDEDGERGALHVSLQVICEVHRRYFGQESGSRPDVRPLLSSIRGAVLPGVTILFSRVIPLDCTNPEAHPLWRLALDLGARCSQVAGEDVTHVVATNHTDKTRWASKAGKFVVNPNWLWCSAFTWARALEERFPLGASSSSAAQQALVRTVEEDVAAALAAAGGGREEDASAHQPPVAQAEGGTPTPMTSRDPPPGAAAGLAADAGEQGMRGMGRQSGEGQEPGQAGAGAAVSIPSEELAGHTASPYGGCQSATGDPAAPGSAAGSSVID